MTVDAGIDVAGIARIRRETDAREVAHATYSRLIELLSELSPDEWQRPTECAPWTVSDMVGHLVGAAKAHASVRELIRQEIRGFRDRGAFDGNAMDAVNDLQVRDHDDLTPTQRLEALRRLAPRAVAGRMQMPGPVRRIDLPIDSTGSAATGMPTSVNLGNLMDAILSRDVWLHRVDIARATDRPVEVEAPVDRRIVEDVVAEWSGRHGRPFRLTLHGPAGGRFRQGEDGETIEMDAVEFCRVLSGRAEGEGLLATRILF